MEHNYGSKRIPGGHDKKRKRHSIPTLVITKNQISGMRFLCGNKDSFYSILVYPPPGLQNDNAILCFRPPLCITKIGSNAWHAALRIWVIVITVEHSHRHTKLQLSVCRVITPRRTRMYTKNNRGCRSSVVGRFTYSTGYAADVTRNGVHYEWAPNRVVDIGL